MEDRVKQALPGAEVDVGLFAGAERINGMISWDGFEDQEMIERQTAIWQVLRAKLGEDAARVSIILTYTPPELELMRAA